MIILVWRISFVKFEGGFIFIFIGFTKFNKCFIYFLIIYVYFFIKIEVKIRLIILILFFNSCVDGGRRFFRSEF